MLTYKLDPKSSNSLYEQLYHAIRTDIETARLAAGSKLPSKRSLARHLGISVITVENAYRQLAAEGYIEAQERRGYFVNELPAVQTHESLHHASFMPHQTTSYSASPTEHPLQTDPKRTASILATPLLADFSGRDRSGNLFPFHIWAKTVRRTLSEASKGLLLRTSYDNRGAEDLRIAIAQHLASFRGLNVSPDQIVIGAGAQDLYGVLVQLLGRDHLFAVEDPGYPALRTHYELSGAEVVSIPVDEKGLDVSALRTSSASVAHCAPAHQFPTGSVLSAVRRRELLDWAQELDVSENDTQKRYIIEDDYDSEFRMRGRPIPPLFTQDLRESVIYMNTFTRSLGSVFRIAYMVLPPHLLALFTQRFATRSCMVGALEQLELSHFIASGDYERHVNRQRTRYRRLQDALVSQLSTSKVGEYLHFSGVGAGLHFLMEIDLPTKDSSEKERFATRLETACLERGVKLMNIDGYRSSASGTSASSSVLTYVMNVSGLNEEDVDGIANAVSEAITVAAVSPKRKPERDALA